MIRMLNIEGDVNPADMLTKYLRKAVWFPYASRLYNTDLSKIPVSASGASVPLAPGGGVR